VVGFLSKVTTGVALTPLLLLTLLITLYQRKNAKETVFRFVFILFSISSGLYSALKWNDFADSVKENNPFTAHLRSNTPQMRNWNFGNIENRFEVESWVTILLQYLGPISAGFFTLLFLSVMAYSKFNKIYIVILLCNVLFPIVLFFNLYKNHQYYISAIYPVIILLMSAGIVSISQLSQLRSKFLNFGLIILLLTTSYSTKYGVNYLADMLNHSKPPYLVEEIKTNVPKGSFVMYLGCDWNPEIPYYIDSPTLMVPEWGIKPLVQDLNSIDYIVFCEDFPLDRENKLKDYFPGLYSKISDDIYKISQR
jgi:hypothetical protein